MAQYSEGGSSKDANTCSIWIIIGCNLTATHYEATSKKQGYYQRCTQKLTAAREKAWASLKQAGREDIRKLVKWCLLPLAIAACFSMIDVSPAELPVDYYAIEDVALIER
jgi:hypothetical protein